RLTGKVAVITGGARGIGAATAKLFAAHGAHVVIADVLDDIESEVESAVNLAINWKGKLDIMFNNAGIPGRDGSITNLDTDETNRILAVNLQGVLNGIKHAARSMIRTGTRGSIICAASSAAVMGGLGSHGYTASKGAIIAAVRSSACELGEHGIRVNCISAHGVPSEMLVGAYRRILGKEEMAAEEGRGGRMDDVANGAVFLASEEEAGFVTGQNLVIDGGFTCAIGNMSFIYRESD
ncbi:Short-chain dehydrogenase reductase ATA1, partial [Linum perenne]